MQLEVLTFKNRSTATEALADIQDDDFDWGTDISEHSVAVSRSKSGRVKIHHAHEARTTGAWIGGATGLLVGSLLLNPLVGTAIGAASGAAIGAAGDPDPVVDYGIDKDFLKELGSGLEKNSSALFVAVPDARAAAAATALAAYAEGSLIQTAIDDQVEENLARQMRNA